jgi:hypothetical protein
MINVMHVDMDPDDYMTRSLNHGVWAGVVAKCVQMSVSADLGFSGARAYHLAEWNVPGAFVPSASPSKALHANCDWFAQKPELGCRLAESLERKQRAVLECQAHLIELWTFFTAVHPALSLILYTTARPWRMQVVTLLDTTFGALALAALWVSGHGASESQNCAAGVSREWSAQDIGIALATSAFAVLPAVLVLALDRPTDPTRKQEWTFGTSGLLVPSLGLVYFGACILTLIVFFANACSTEADRWLVILLTQLVLNWLILPSVLTLAWSAVIRVMAGRPELMRNASSELRHVLGGECKLSDSDHGGPWGDPRRGSARTCWASPDELRVGVKSGDQPQDAASTWQPQDQVNPFGVGAGVHDRFTAPEVAVTLREAASPPEITPEINKDLVAPPVGLRQGDFLVVEDVTV